jgi:hypothetical protein
MQIYKSNAKLQESAKADLSSVKNDISSTIGQLQENNAKFLENLRAEIKSENDKLIKRFELQAQKANKELSGRPDRLGDQLIW